MKANMKKNKKLPGILIGLVTTAFFIIAACGGDGTSAPPTAAAIPAPVPTVASTTAPAAIPTSTVAATATAVPTSTVAAAATSVPTIAPSPTTEPAMEGMELVSVTIGPSKDNTLYEKSENFSSNGAGFNFFAGQTNRGLIRRGLIAFDVAGSVPQGVTIENVTLNMRMSRSTAGDKDIQLHRLLADWGEGASKPLGNGGEGDPSEAGDATWVHAFYDPDDLNAGRWQDPGGDFSPTPSVKMVVRGKGKYDLGSTNSMVADVQAWLDDPSTNFGWLVKGEEAEGGGRSAKRFDSRETTDEGNRPALTIVFTVEGGTEDGPTSRNRSGY